MSRYALGMGVYTRFKRDPDGFRKLVELLETTPATRRTKMIEVGKEEDPGYTQKALTYVLTFDDLAQLPDAEIAELVAIAPARTVAYALHQAPPEVQERYLRTARGDAAMEIRDYWEQTITLTEIGGARLKLIEFARQLEKKGLLSVKKIPIGAG